MSFPITDQQVDEIVQRVRARLGRNGAAEQRSPSAATDATARSGEGIFNSIDGAVEASWTAFQEYRSMGLDRREAVVTSVRSTMRQHARDLAVEAWEETGLGRPEDKLEKNILVVEKTPGTEDLQPQAQTGDRGLTVIEWAPFGVVAAITPTTNPTATIINNTIAVTAAGNSLVFNVHPNAKKVSVRCVRLINQAIVRAGGPANLVTCIANPTLESANQLMNHPRVRILLVTGGPGVVKAALATHKRAITAGPGNPPVVVDESADIDLAGREIVRGASFDNNVICTDEKEVFVVNSVADQLLQALCDNRAILLKDYQVKQLEKVIFKELGPPGKPGKINPKYIGKNANVILAELGISADDEIRLLLADVHQDHSLVWTEQMMPVLPIVRVDSVDQAISLAVRAEHGFGHTAAIFSRNVDTITRLAREINVSIFTANGSTLAGLGAGGEGYTSFSIASPTGEGMTRPRTFSRQRRLCVADGLRIV